MSFQLTKKEEEYAKAGLNRQFKTIMESGFKEIDPRLGAEEVCVFTTTKVQFWVRFEKQFFPVAKEAIEEVRSEPENQGKTLCNVVFTSILHLQPEDYREAKKFITFFAKGEADTAEYLVLFKPNRSFTQKHPALTGVLAFFVASAVGNLAGWAINRHLSSQ